MLKFAILKSSTKCYHFLGNFILSKNHNELSKVTQLEKIDKSGHPGWEGENKMFSKNHFETTPSFAK
jgi:hypothetical protein